MTQLLHGQVMREKMSENEVRECVAKVLLMS